MNLIKSLTARIQAAREGNKTPCKSYATEARAEVEAEKVAQQIATYFSRTGDKSARPARYVILKIEDWNRYVICFDMSEVLMRSDSTGGYIGIAGNHFTY